MESSEIVAHSLSMPHSRRFYRDKLWLHNSSAGESGTVDLQNGKFESVTFAPWYLHGLSFHGDYAVIGLTKPRDNKTFAGLPMPSEKNAEVQFGLQVVNLVTGDAVHWLKVDGIVEKLYNLVVLPTVRRPAAFGFKTDEIHHTPIVSEVVNI